MNSFLEVIASPIDTYLNRVGGIIESESGWEHLFFEASLTLPTGFTVKVLSNGYGLFEEDFNDLEDQNKLQAFFTITNDDGNEYVLTAVFNTEATYQIVNRKMEQKIPNLASMLESLRISTELFFLVIDSKFVSPLSIEFDKQTTDKELGNLIRLAADEMLILERKANRQRIESE